MKEIKKLMPQIKQQVTQAVEVAQKSMEQIDIKKASNKIQQAVQLVKRKIDNLNKSSKNNEIKININNKEAEKQISQIQKQIDSLQEKINSRQMKLNLITPRLDKITSDTTKAVTPDGISSNNPAIQKTINNSLNSNKEYTTLLAQEEKLVQEIQAYNRQLDEAKTKMSELSRQTEETATTQNKLSSFFSAFKNKIDQTKPSINSMKAQFTQMPKITQKVTNNIKNMGAGLKSGLRHVIKYAGALLSIRGIYGLLRSTASAWLSSQNAGAKQLSANIDYMKYAMGSALAPVIQFVINLVYQLMRAIQSVAYALTGVNIFANASAKAYSSMADSAKKASKETNKLADIDEIHNIQKDNNSGDSGSVAPNFDLSQIDLKNSIVDLLKKGNWHEIGVTVGKKINEAMKKIPWNTIKETAGNIGTNLAEFINGSVETINWEDVGGTIAEGVNTAFRFLGRFFKTANFKEIGRAIARTINGFFDTVDWNEVGQTLSDGVKDALDLMIGFIEKFDTSKVYNAVIRVFENIDWSGIMSKLIELLGWAVAILSGIPLAYNIGKKIVEAVMGAKDYFKEKVEECGGNIVSGIFKGIKDAIVGIGQWIYDNIFQPFINGFKSAFGIHSPSTVMMEMGGYIIEGLRIGLSGIWDKVKSIFTNFVSNVGNKFSEMKNSIKTKLDNVKSTIGSWGSNIGSTFSRLGSNALTWGRDLVSNIASGIKNNISRVTSAVSTVASKIKSFLHFSEPDTGPLSNFHTYMPDMINLMTKGIHDNMGKVTNELENLTTQMSYTINTPDIASIPLTNNIQTNSIKPQNMIEQTFDKVLSKYNTNNNSGTINFTNELKINSKTIAREIIQDLSNEAVRLGYRPILQRG